MIGTGAAILGAAALGTVGSIAAGSMAKSGAEKAAASNETAAKYAADLQNQQYQQTRADLEPWRYAGGNALNWMMRGLTGESIPSMTPGAAAQPQAPAQTTQAQPANAFAQQPMIWRPGESNGGSGDFRQETPGQWVPNPAYNAAPQAQAPVATATPAAANTNTPEANRNAFMQMFQTSPDYQFRMGEGVKALDRSASARGMISSGAQQKAITQYGQNLAAGEYGNFYNRLASLAGIGQTATNTTAAAGQAAAANSGNAMMQGANAAGNARQSGYNAMASGIGAGVNNAMFGLMQYGRQPAAYSNPWANVGTGTGGTYG